jgi:hypothetical protein
MILATKLSSALATGIISNTRAKEENIKAFQIVNRIVYRIRFAVDSDLYGGRWIGLGEQSGKWRRPCSICSCFHN